MANSSPQLEAAIARFASQQGVSADQVAQLRSAITADATLLRQFDQQAQAGHLRGFALQGANGTAPNLAGTYDIQSGIVTLPAASFQPSATAASSDLKATLQVQQMSVEFGHSTYQDAARNSHPVTQDMLANLQSTINGSPVLADELKKAATIAPREQRAQIESFGFVGPGATAGGTYDGDNRSMNLPPLGLQTRSASNPQGRFNDTDMTFVLGHEIQHSFNHPAKTRATADFLRNVATQAQIRGPIHDYTDELRAYIQAGRDDEAKAEIAGWNALLSREKQSNPNSGLVAMYQTRNDRVLDFVERDNATRAINPKPGLTFNQDGTLSQTPGNIAAMGHHYFDRPSPNYAQPGQRPVSIGEHKDHAGNLRPTADYPNYYGTWAVEKIVQAEDQANVTFQGARPRVTIGMASLGLREDLIENEGLDLGRDKTPRPYYDSSQTPPALHHFDHTQDGSVSPAQDHTYVPATAAVPAATAVGPDDPVHPDHAMLEQIRSGVRKIDEGIGKPYDAMSECVSRSLLAACKDNREAYPNAGHQSLAENALGRVDHVLMGKTGNIFAVEGALDDPAHKRAHVSIEQATQTPVEQSDAKLQLANQAIAQERQMAQQHELSRSVNDPSQGGPTR